MRYAVVMSLSSLRLECFQIRKTQKAAITGSTLTARLLLSIVCTLLSNSVAKTLAWQSFQATGWRVVRMNWGRSRRCTSEQGSLSPLGVSRRCCCCRWQDHRGVGAMLLQIEKNTAQFGSHEFEPSDGFHSLSLFKRQFLAFCRPNREGLLQPAMRVGGRQLLNLLGKFCTALFCMSCERFLLAW